MRETMRCYCGQLSITVSAPPVHHHGCACTLCQRRSGSVMTETGWFREADIAEISGEMRLWHSAGDDRPDIVTASCAVCGGGGYARTGDYLPGTLALPMGGFLGAFGPPEHVHFWGYRADWFTLDCAAVALHDDP